MPVETVIDDARWTAVGIGALCDRAIGAALTNRGLDPDRWDVAVLACDDARIAELNTQFRGKAVPTNVLSWPSADRAAPALGAHPAPPDATVGPELGDIAIAYDTCLREARQAGRSLGDHATHLVVHALLHLLGYDHTRDADAALMEGLETEILATLGVPDPY